MIRGDLQPELAAHSGDVGRYPPSTDVTNARGLFAEEGPNGDLHVTQARRVRRDQIRQKADHRPGAVTVTDESIAGTDATRNTTKRVRRGRATPPDGRGDIGQQVRFTRLPP